MWGGIWLSKIPGDGERESSWCPVSCGGRTGMILTMNNFEIFLWMEGQARRNGLKPCGFPPFTEVVGCIFSFLSGKCYWTNLAITTELFAITCFFSYQLDATLLTFCNDDQSLRIIPLPHKWFLVFSMFLISSLKAFCSPIQCGVDFYLSLFRVKAI